MFQGGLEIASSLVHGSEPRQSSSHTQLVTVVPEELEAFSVTLHGLVQVSDRFVDRTPFTASTINDATGFQPTRRQTSLRSTPPFRTTFEVL